MDVTSLRFDFMRWRKVALVVSGTLTAISIIWLIARGLVWGLDFTGGTVVELGYAQPADLGAIRAVLAKSEFSGAVVQHYGAPQDVLVRLPLAPQETASADVTNRVTELLPEATVRRAEFVGPQVGDELAEDGMLAMLVALGGIFVYVAVRFERKFAIGAIVATVHDVLIVVGFFAVTRMEFDLTVLAAVLAVIGWSLNDTVVVFDRIRENFRRMRKAGVIDIMNISINQTLSRTLVTGVTTILVLISLFFLGGALIHAFATALLVGIVIGTYSSIYIASPVTLALGIARADLMEPQKEGEGADGRP